MGYPFYKVHKKAASLQRGRFFEVDYLLGKLDIAKLCVHVSLYGYIVDGCISITIDAINKHAVSTRS